MNTKNIPLTPVELTIVLEALSLKLKLRESGIVKESSKVKSQAMINETDKLFKKLINDHCEVINK